jgi:DNA-binding response OmpR family regulator
MSEDKLRLSERKILVVDDDPDILATIGAVMEAEGAEVETVDNGNSAVKACTDWQPDLVVLDMMLPKRSGFLVLEKIKGRADSPLVVMITANEGRRHQNYAKELGADRYMQKPVPLALLVSTAVDMLSEREKEEVDLDLSEFEEVVEAMDVEEDAEADPSQETEDETDENEE